MEQYIKIRKFLVDNKQIITEIEQSATDQLYQLIVQNKSNIENDYNCASDLRPFWLNYPPDDRGRQPRGDQIPWIEVGEHAVGDNVISNIHHLGEVRFQGIPAGPDIRYTVINDQIKRISNGFIDGYWSMTDVKSVGPRDNFDHAVMSHNQVSGSGEFDAETGGILNSIMTATGSRASHEFHCSLPPLYILPDGRILLTVTLFIKPIYNMGDGEIFSQKLSEIKVGCIPNGLLLSGKGGYLEQYPGLLYPGKDDKGKNPKKLRARIDFKILEKLDKWRLQSITF